MRLDLKEILDKDGVIPFQYAMDLEGLDFPSISRFLSPLQAEGKVTSQAGVLTLTGTAGAKLQCICDRCGAEYIRDAVAALDTAVADELQDEENPDVYLLEDCGLDLDEVVSTAFVLGLDTKLLCRPDCKGVCPSCGQNLNDGPCACRPEPDSRLAVLGQLLEQQ